MKEIKSIILYLDSLVAIEHLTDEQAGILIKAVLRYAKDGQHLANFFSKSSNYFVFSNFQ